MLQTIPKTVELLANGLVLAPVPADKAQDDCYSAKMCSQPVELILEGITEMLPDPKRKRRAVQRFKRMVFVTVMMPHSREHRAAPRRGGGTGREDSGDDGGGPSEPPPHRKSERGPRAAIELSLSRAPRVQHGRARSRFSGRRS